MYDRVAGLPLTVEEYELERRERDTSSGFVRTTTTVVLRGEGHAGRGEDVTYETADHDAFQEGFDADLAGEYTLDSFSQALDDVPLWPDPPSRDAFRDYRRWAFESAALDLALRENGQTLGEALDRRYDPVRFVVSTRLRESEDEPPTAERVEQWRDLVPDIEFKLDPTPAWSEDLIETLAATDAVRVVDLKAHYEGTEVDTEPGPEFYRRVIEGFPEAYVEDPGLTDETRPILEPAAGRLSWDAPIHGVESLSDLPFESTVLNCKPSRFGTVRSLLEFVEHCEKAGIDLYGGGQFELGVGRAQIQALASLFYADSPNDVAPREYNAPEPRAGLPRSPLEPPEPEVGFAGSEE